MGIVNIKRIDTFNDFFRDNEDKRVLALYGGAGSGKSRSIIEELIIKMWNEKDISILVCRKTTPALDKTAWHMFLEILEEWGMRHLFSITRNPKTITFTNNGNICWFDGMDDPSKKKSLNINYVYLEEATEFTEEDYNQISLRLRKVNENGRNHIYLSFNPTHPYHWSAGLIKNKYPDVATHHSTYLDNSFLDKDYTDALEEYKNRNPNMYKIYTLGEFGFPQNIIYPHWQTCKVLPPLNDSIIAYGLDFGYTNPTALVEIRYYRNAFYVKERLYQTKLTNPELIEKMLPIREQGHPVFCDTAQPAVIAELSLAGICALESDKDVLAGINYVRSSPLYITEDSPNLLAEIAAYQFRENKEKMVMEEPVKVNDHLMDAMRYAIYNLRVTPGMPMPIEEQVKKIPSLERKVERKVEKEETIYDTIAKREEKKRKVGIPHL